MKIDIETWHLSQDLIFRFLDDELGTSARREADAHLAICEICRRQLASFRELSMEVEAAIGSTAIPSMPGIRQDLQKTFQLQSSSALQHPAKVMRRFGWGMGVAASLAFGVLMATRYDFSPSPQSAATSQLSGSTQPGKIEVDGETFLPVPYSNTDLSTSAPHIVQMKVPVSSLTEIGIVLEPVTNRASASELERSVLTDVLVGADGQPRGVHVLAQE